MIAREIKRERGRDERKKLGTIILNNNFLNGLILFLELDREQYLKSRTRIDNMH